MDEGRIEAKNAPSAGAADSQIPMYEEGRSSFCPERRPQPDEFSKTRMKNKKWNLILIGRIVFFCAIILPALGLATTYYVATNGKDSYNGLFPSYQSGSNGPFRTLNRASARVAAGDSVKIRGGTYHETVTWSTSGTAANVVKAIKVAKDMGMKTVGLTGGDGGDLAKIVDFALVVDSSATPRIQETHITIGHVLCEMVDRMLFQQPG